jgi:hypothetical protein
MTLNYKTSFSTPFFEIEEAINPNNLNEHPYYRMTGCDSVICCVMTLDGKFVMIEQFRPNIEEYSLEFPAGGIKINENPITAAKREFAEETSMLSDFIFLGDFKLMMNRTNIKEHIFFGMNPKKDIPQNHEEGIEVKLIDRNKLIDLSVNGQYKQLAGLGVIQLVSLSLEIDILREPISKIIDKYNKRKK